MNLTTSEAQSALESIDAIQDRMRKAIVAGHGGALLILWGVIWMLGYSLGQFFPQWRDIQWPPLALVGAFLSIWVGRNGGGVRSPHSARFIFFFLGLFAFAFAWAYALHPFNQRHLAVFIGLVPMFAYFAGGLWFGRLFSWLGIGVTVVALAAIKFLPNWVNLVMAVVGGGGLLASGLYIKSCWK